MTDRNLTRRGRGERVASPPGETHVPGAKPLQIVMEPGQTPESMLATTVVRPTVKAAATIKSFDLKGHSARWI